MSKESVTAEFLIQFEKEKPVADLEKWQKTGFYMPLDLSLAIDQYLLKLQAHGIKMDKKDYHLEAITFFSKTLGIVEEDYTPKKQKEIE